MPAFNPHATTPETGRKRARRMYRDLRPCEKCGAKPRETKIGRHHKDENTFNNDIENIQWLCMPCHLAEHNYLREYKSNQKTDVNRRRKRRSKRSDTKFRPGDTCPNCGKRLYSVQTFYSRQDGLRYIYIACPVRYGGCGDRAGSYTTPVAGR